MTSGHGWREMRFVLSDSPSDTSVMGNLTTIGKFYREFWKTCLVERDGLDSGGTVKVYRFQPRYTLGYDYREQWYPWMDAGIEVPFVLYEADEQTNGPVAWESWHLVESTRWQWYRPSISPSVTQGFLVVVRRGPEVDVSS